MLLSHCCILIGLHGHGIIWMARRLQLVGMETTQIGMETIQVRITVIFDLVHLLVALLSRAML